MHEVERYFRIALVGEVSDDGLTTKSTVLHLTDRKKKRRRGCYMKRG